MKPIAFNYAEYEKLQAAYEKQKGIIKELLDVFKKLLAVNDTLEADLAAAVEDFTSAAHNGNILCEFCGADCIDAGNDTGGDTFQCGCFKWRGRPLKGESE